MNTGLGQYMDIFKDAVEDSAKDNQKVSRKYSSRIILFMVFKKDKFHPKMACMLSNLHSA